VVGRISWRAQPFSLLYSETPNTLLQLKLNAS
jgi:hypothetical protein